MKYKVVQTIEKGEMKLTSIPESWEKDGVLYWPKRNKVEKFKNKVDPENDWEKMNCIVKRKNIPTFKEAEAELQNMCKYSDTETESGAELPAQRKIKKKNVNIQHIPDFNSLVQECLASDDQPTDSTTQGEDHIERGLDINEMPSTSSAVHTAVNCAKSDDQPTESTTQGEDHIERGLDINEMPSTSSAVHTAVNCAKSDDQPTISTTRGVDHIQEGLDNNSAPSTMAVHTAVDSAKTDEQRREPNAQEMPSVDHVGVEINDINNITMPSTTGLQGSNQYTVKAATTSDISTVSVNENVPYVAHVPRDLVYYETQQTGEGTTILLQQSNDLESKIDNISTKLNLLIENQDKLSSELVRLNHKIEEFIRGFLSGKSEGIKNVEFEVIDKVENLEKFESNLKNPTYKGELLKKFSVVCSKQNGKGINAAYKHIDLIFNRDFLKLCSWAGGSRNDDKKICFKSFNRTIDVFFNMVKATDDLFTLNDCEQFFKNILKNAKKRSLTMNVRQSCTKKRNKRNKNDQKPNDARPPDEEEQNEEEEESLL